MKIAYIVSLFPCLSETFILREIEELSNLGYDITIFSLKSARKKKLRHEAARKYRHVTHYPHILSFFIAILHPLKFIKLATKIFKYNKSNFLYLLKSFYIIPIAMQYAEIMKQKDIKHLHAHWATIPTSAAWIVNEITEIPYSFTAHAWDIWKNNEMLLVKIKDAKFTATISGFNKKLLSQDLSRRTTNKINIVHCGIDVDKFNYSQPQPYKKLKIISVGRFVEKKGFIYLVKACRQLLDRGFEFECSIVGKGPLWKEIAELITTLNMENHVNLPGAMAQEILQEEFKNSDLFVLPAVKAGNGDLDGIPVVLMEAMALGIPVISTKVSGIPELIDNGKSGLLVDEKNVSQLADTIEQFSSFSNFNIKFAVAGRRKIEQEFNIKKSAYQMSDLIQA